MLNTPMPVHDSDALILGCQSSKLQSPLDEQTAACEVRQKSGSDVTRKFEDEVKSGRSVARRSDFVAIMAAAAAGNYEVVVATSRDRIGRNGAASC